MDTSQTTIPNAQLRRALIEHQWRIFDSVNLAGLNQKVRDLTNLNASYFKTINDMQAQLNAQGAQYGNCMLLTNNYQQQIKIGEQNVAVLNKALKRQKHKTVLAEIAGIIAVGGLTYLYITK